MTKVTEADPKKKVRITVDLSQDAYTRLDALEQNVGAESKATVVRQALQLYEFIAKRHREGCEFRAVYEGGKEETIVFLGPVG